MPVKIGRTEKRRWSRGVCFARVHLMQNVAVIKRPGFAVSADPGLLRDALALLRLLRNGCLVRNGEADFLDGIGNFLPCNQGIVKGNHSVFVLQAHRCMGYPRQSGNRRCYRSHAVITGHSFNGDCDCVHGKILLDIINRYLIFCFVRCSGAACAGCFVHRDFRPKTPKQERVGHD